MTKTVTLRDDLFDLNKLILEAFEQEKPGTYGTPANVYAAFGSNRLKELLEVFVAAKAAIDDPAGLDFDLPAPPPRDDPEPPVPPTVHGEPLTEYLYHMEGVGDVRAAGAPTKKKAKSRAKLPSSPTSRKTPNWTLREDEILLCYKDVEPKDWSEIEARLPGRNVSACKSRLKRLMEKKTGYVKIQLPDGGVLEIGSAITASPIDDEPYRNATDEQVRRALEPVPVTVPKEELILSTDADGKVTEASTQEIAAWAHPAIKDDEPFIRQPTALEKMVGGFKRSGL